MASDAPREPSEALSELLRHGPPAQAERLRKAVDKLMERFPGCVLEDCTPHELRQLLDLVNAQSGASGGKRSGESRKRKRREDLDVAADALRRLRERNEFKRYTLADLVLESGLPLRRLRDLTLQAIKAHARKK